MKTCSRCGDVVRLCQCPEGPDVRLAVRRFLDSLPDPKVYQQGEYTAVYDFLQDLDSDDLDGNDLGDVEASLEMLASEVAHMQKLLTAHRSLHNAYHSENRRRLAKKEG